MTIRQLHIMICRKSLFSANGCSESGPEIQQPEVGLSTIRFEFPDELPII